MKLVSSVLLLLGFCISSLRADESLSAAEISLIETTATRFATAFKGDDEETLLSLLVTRTVLRDIAPASALGEFTYEDLVRGNILRFREWRGAFGDLKKYDLDMEIIVTPGRRIQDNRLTSETLVKNTFVELRYANRIKITLKIENMVVTKDRSYILSID